MRFEVEAGGDGVAAVVNIDFIPTSPPMWRSKATCRRDGELFRLGVGKWGWTPEQIYLSREALVAFRGVIDAALAVPEVHPPIDP